MPRVAACSRATSNICGVMSVARTWEDVGGKGEGGVAGGGGDVQRLPVRLGFDQLDQSLQTGALGVGLAGDIGPGIGAELLLHLFS